MEQMSEVAIDLNRSGAKVNYGISKPDAYNDFFVGTTIDRFTLVGAKEGFYQGESSVTTGGKENDTFYVDILMDPIPILVTIEVKNIYYELDKADLRTESMEALDSLYNIMKSNPQIIVEFGSHTDSRNSNEYNIDLSQRRAQSVVDFLMAKGIDTARMRPKGYGEEVPKTLSTEIILPSGAKVPAGTVLVESFINKYRGNKDDFEALHQINRRTEFKILGEIPNTVVKYDEAQIEAEKARMREEEEKRNKILQDLQLIDEGDVNYNEQENQQQSEQTQTKTTTTTAATLDPTLTKKGNMYEGNAMVNGSMETKYILNLSPSVTVAMVSKNFFISLWDAGLVSDSDFKNDKPTDLGNGTVVRGDVFTLRSIQLGDIMLNNVEVKLNMTSTQNMIVPVKVVEKGGCSFDANKVRLKCK
jgi:outer membrane protein OmpA-like peptidoglycan-associated protein